MSEIIILPTVDEDHAKQQSIYLAMSSYIGHVLYGGADIEPLVPYCQGGKRGALYTNIVNRVTPSKRAITILSTGIREDKNGTISVRVFADQVGPNPQTGYEYTALWQKGEGGLELTSVVAVNVAVEEKAHG
ncbi:MAG: hypothetical protein AAGF33_00370 [Pseudomonadota bacterium]